MFLGEIPQVRLRSENEPNFEKIENLDPVFICDFELENQKFFKSHSFGLKLRLLGELETLIPKNDFSNSKSACHVVKNAKNSKIVTFLGWRPILKVF